MTPEERAEKVAFSAMLSIVNEWHRQVGIDEVMKTKLTRKIADTVATGIVTGELTKALRDTRQAALREAAEVARRYIGTEPLVADIERLGEE